MSYDEIAELVKNKFLSKLEAYELKNLADLENLHKELISIRTTLYFDFGFDVHPHYRGEQLFGRDILPGMLRLPFVEDIDLGNVRKIEYNGIKIFHQRVLEKYGEKFIFTNPKETDHSLNWNLLFQAQHAGVKTNLIDLSTSVFHSAFFASEPSIKYDDNDGQLWCLLVPSEFIYGESTLYDNPCYSSLNPFNLDSSFVCNVPTFIDDINERTYQFRLFRQHGRLFASSDKEINVPLNEKSFWKNMILRLKISPENKKIIFQQLNEIGISHSKLVLEETEESKEFIKFINEDMKKNG